MIPERSLRRLEELKRSVAFFEEKRRHAEEEIVRAKVEIELLMRDDYRQAPIPSAPARSHYGSAAPPSVPRSMAARLMISALEEAGPAGLSGGELNAVVIKGGLTKDAAEKAKARMKEAKYVVHDGKRWYSLSGAPPAITGLTENQGS
ncbi:hypothetical protein [Enterovirga sp. CN4-39]|uniref:hypothetical protein n=1 Tax=Enterovirga sp. CN4-39 TaxID=3400910 RepID=UPI003C088AF7